MTSEPVVGVVFGRPVEGKMTLSYICLPFHSPTQASQLTGTSSYYRFRCHYPLITYLSGMHKYPKPHGFHDSNGCLHFKTKEVLLGISAVVQRYLISGVFSPPMDQMLLYSDLVLCGFLVLEKIAVAKFAVVEIA